jgi:hypothetical protein
VLVDRRPDWLAAWVEWLCDRPGGWPSFFWPQIRRLVREGLCPVPAHDNYILGMVGGIHRMIDDDGPFWGRHDGGDIALGLKSDPGLLENEVWRLFEVEGTRDLQLNHLWEKAMLALVEQGALPRRRVLEASLDALARDFAHFKAGWYSRFHEKLEPTVEERCELGERYLGLISSPVPPTVTLALRALEQVRRAGGLDAEALLGRVAPALTARHKGTVKLALALLRRSVSPPALSRACRVAADALTHEAADVHKWAIDFLEALGDREDEAVRDAWAGRLEDVCASQRPRLVAWLGEEHAPDGAAAQADVDVERLAARARQLQEAKARLVGVDLALEALQSGVEVHAATPVRMELPCLREPVTPVDDLEAVLDLAAMLLEQPDQPEEVERLLDGVSRLCQEELDEDRVAPLLKRSRTLRRRVGEPFSGVGSIRLALCGLVEAWITREAPKVKRRRASDLDDFVDGRVLEIARRAAARQQAPLLAAPTHRGGWVDPRVLLARGRSLTRTPDPLDSVQALLRLAPEGRAEVLSAFARPGSEIGHALRYACGGDPPRRTVCQTEALWVAAARARAPLSDDDLVRDVFGTGGSDGAEAARYHARVVARKYGEHTHHALFVDSEPRSERAAPPQLPTVGFHGPGPMADAAMVKLLALIWPANRQSFLAEGARRIGNNLDWWEAEWPNRCFLEPLLDAWEPPGAMGTLLAALALGAKEPGEQGLGLDVVIAGLEEGRLDGETLGAWLAALLPQGLLEPGRIARALSDAARVSMLHRTQVRRALERSLRGDPAQAPRGLAPVLELLHELCLECGLGVTDGEARAYLEGVRGSSKRAKAARQLLDLAPTDRREAVLRAAAAEALESRLARAEEL